MYTVKYYIKKKQGGRFNGNKIPFVFVVSGYGIMCHCGHSSDYSNQADAYMETDLSQVHDILHHYDFTNDVVRVVQGKTKAKMI